MPKRPMKGTTVAMICPTHHIFVKGDSCSKCNEEISKRIDGPAIQVFKPMWYEDICETPLWVESKKQLNRECKKHNVIACRLL